MGTAMDIDLDLNLENGKGISMDTMMDTRKDLTRVLQEVDIDLDKKEVIKNG